MLGNNAFGEYAFGEQAGATTAPADTTAPTITSATATATGSTTATGSVTTNEAGGTLYWLVNSSATATAAQVKAASNKAVTAAGAQSVSLTGLSPASTLYLHFLHADAATPPNESTVANTASFTTSAAPVTLATTVTFSVAIDNAGTPAPDTTGLDYAVYEATRINANALPIKYGANMAIVSGTVTINIAGVTTLAPGGMVRVSYGPADGSKIASALVAVS